MTNKGLSTNIAWRYLYGKKSTNAINIITGISIFGITIGTAALILILSVFNGFEGLLSGLFNAFNPDIKVVPVEGKFFELDEETLQNLKSIAGIEAVAKTVEEVALFEYKGLREFGNIKGVDQSYLSVTRIDTHLINGKFLLLNNRINYAVLGSGIRNKLAVNTEDRLTPITIFMPARKKRGPLDKEFISKEAYPSGVFTVRSETDLQFILCELGFVQNLLQNPNKISALEIKIGATANEEMIITQIHNLLGEGYKIKNRYQQDEAYLKVMQIEKWFSYLITGLTIFLVAFNLVGALWMIALDKKKDISILKSLGYTDQGIRQLFVSLGILITLLGICFGFVLSLIVIFLQKNYGLVGIPDGFLIDAYPVKINLGDFLITFITVLFIGWVASLLPANKAAKTQLALK